MRTFVAAVVLMICSPSAPGWDAHGHRVITLLALDGLPVGDKPAPGAAVRPTMPLWLTDPRTRAQVAYQCAEPDRIRAQPTPALVHINGPDHYLDVDMLERWGLTLETMPSLRHRFIKEMSLRRVERPENFKDYNPSKDAANEYEWPGLVAHAVMESYGQLQASFRTLKIIELLGVEGREVQYGFAKDNIAYHMGRLSHFIGDIAQPLHTTIHHHGWVGGPANNPHNYSTDYGIHAYIDGTILVHHKLTYESLRPAQTYQRKVNADDPWKDVLDHIRRSHALVETLYRMHQDDSLRSEAGKAFIAERLHDGAEMLSAMYAAAWDSSDPTKRDMDYYINGTPKDNGTSLPEMGNRKIPARSASDRSGASPEAKPE